MSKRAPDASVTITVNVPSWNYEASVRRALLLLKQGGFEAYAMTAEYILKQAAQIQADMAASAESERLLAHAHTTRKETQDAPE